MGNHIADDFVEAQEQANREQERLIKNGEKLDILIHRTFRQTESGRELLDLWIKKALIMKDIVRHGESHDPYDIGIEAGLQRFIRNIIRTCEKVDKQ